MTRYVVIKTHIAYGAEAWEHCEKLCEEKNGRGLKVIGAGSSIFSAGFIFEEDGQRKLMYITKADERVIDYKGGDDSDES